MHVVWDYRVCLGLLSCTCFVAPQAKLLEYLRQAIPSFPSDCQQLQVRQFSHGQSNPTYLLRVGRLAATPLTTHVMTMTNC